MEWNLGSCGVGIPLGRVILVEYLIGQPYKLAPKYLVKYFCSTSFVAIISLCTYPFIVILEAIFIFYCISRGDSLSWMI